MTYWEGVAFSLKLIAILVTAVFAMMLVLGLIHQLAEIWIPDLVQWVKKKVFEEGDADE